MNYYNEIKQAIINNEITKKVKEYTQSRLRYMRRFYEVFSKGPTLSDLLSYTLLLLNFFIKCKSADTIVTIILL